MINEPSPATPLTGAEIDEARIRHEKLPVMLPHPLVQARQIVGAWRAVGNGNSEVLLIRYIYQAIEENVAESDRLLATLTARDGEIERLIGERGSLATAIAEAAQAAGIYNGNVPLTGLGEAKSPYDDDAPTGEGE